MYKLSDITVGKGTLPAPQDKTVPTGACLRRSADGVEDII